MSLLEEARNTVKEWASSALRSAYIVILDDALSKYTEAFIANQDQTKLMWYQGVLYGIKLSKQLTNPDYLLAIENRMKPQEEDVSRGTPKALIRNTERVKTSDAPAE